MLILGKEVNIQDIVHIINLKDEGKTIDQINELSKLNKDIILFTFDNLTIDTFKNMIYKRITPDISQEEIDNLKMKYGDEMAQEMMNSTEEGAVYHSPWIKL